MGIPSLKHPFPDQLPKGYRKLSSSETVQKEDLLWNPIKGKWVQASGWIEENGEDAGNFRYAISKSK
jgi:hypothetical protein